MRRLARDAEWARHVRERVPRLECTADVATLEFVELASELGQDQERLRGLWIGEGALEQRDNPLRVGGHALTTQ